VKTPPSFQIGQCWTSEGEPELGIGFVKIFDNTSVAIEFPSASQARLYRIKAPPLRRLEFRMGEKVQAKSGEVITIERIEVRDHLIWYVAVNDTEICESELSPKLTLQRPMDRFLAGHWDPFKAFSLRRRTLEFYYRHLNSPARGMIGPRVQLLPHQVYVTQEICSRGLPRALLADEVGLGKTIEAAWIMHRLLATGRIRRVLIIVPESLVNQWFVELFRRFNLSFWVPASQADGLLEVDDISDQERVILSTESVASFFEQGLLKATDWDLVIVDEAHRVTWNKDLPSAEYQVLQALAEKMTGLLLLTATPEQLGLEGHYSRLHLIDPERFPSLEQFETEHGAYLRLVGLAERILSGGKLTATEKKTLKILLEGIVPPEEIESSLTRRSTVLALIDHYGTGRVYFRNSRSVVELEHCAFPKRNLERHPIQGSKVTETNEGMIQWLAGFAKSHTQEKSLLICSSAKQVIEWERRLRDEFALKVVAFHEELSLLARDRNAAYFEDPAGATILLCSEIGGEGRNFQHASHLILADLPEDPDVLEQRIGRLDRIGQASDISIHVPFIAQSHTERLLRFHDEVFQAFSKPPKGAREVYEIYRDELIALREESKFQPSTKASQKKINDGFLSLLARAQKTYQVQLLKIEAGRDRLIEMNSFDPDLAPKLVQTLEKAESTEELKLYFEDLLDAMGLHSEDLDADSLFVDPGHGQYVSYFPGLPAEGLSFTFSRLKALRRTDLALMTWDHPMVTETLAQIAGQEFGNVSVAGWSRSQVAIECTFVLQAAATESKWFADEFFPSTPIRIVIEATGKDMTSELDWETLSKSLVPLNATAAAFVKKLPGERIRGLLNKALSQAQGVSNPIKFQALSKMNAAIDAEIGRLEAFDAKNEFVSSFDLQWWEERKVNLLKAFSGAQVRLDSFLLVVPEQLGS
jgi:ATP-dependent helicase HepA